MCIRVLNPNGNCHETTTFGNAPVGLRVQVITFHSFNLILSLITCVWLKHILASYLHLKILMLHFFPLVNRSYPWSVAIIFTFEVVQHPLNFSSSPRLMYRIGPNGETSTAHVYAWQIVGITVEELLSLKMWMTNT